MNKVEWQEIQTGGGCKVYGADFSEGSISMSEDSLIVIKDNMTFSEFWDAYEDEEAEAKNSHGMVHFDGLSICDFHDFIYKMELDAHFSEIALKWIGIRS